MRWNGILWKWTTSVSVNWKNYFFTSVANLSNLHVDSKFFYLGKVLLRGIILNSLCGCSDIDVQKFCKYVWDNLFWKYSVEKECWSENLVFSNDRNKLAIDIFRKCDRERNNLMLVLALNGLGSAYSLFDSFATSTFL